MAIERNGHREREREREREMAIERERERDNKAIAKERVVVDLCGGRRGERGRGVAASPGHVSVAILCLELGA